MNDDRLDWHLWNWTQWHRRSHSAILRELWYPAHASSGLGSCEHRTFDEMVEAVDARCAVALEAALDDCSTVQRAAVHHIHLAAVFRIRARIEDAYASAREIVRRGLMRRGIM